MDINSLLEFNNNFNIIEDVINDSKVYIIDNFLKRPYQLVSFLKTVEPEVWKKEIVPSNNGVYFLDRRHKFKYSNPFKKFVDQFIFENVQFENIISTNCFKMFKHPFNDYRNCFWSPHKDRGYNALIYLNDYDGPGTNFYHKLENYDANLEHYDPWRPRHKYKLIKTIEAKFNRFIFFDGSKTFHGMAVEDDTFFYVERMNVVLFINKKGESI